MLCQTFSKQFSQLRILSTYIMNKALIALIVIVAIFVIWILFWGLEVRCRANIPGIDLPQVNIPGINFDLNWYEQPLHIPIPSVSTTYGE
jgi:hypothetical protein